VSETEALEWLTREAVERWGKERESELREMLKSIAEAMAAVSAVELPEEVEPAWP
jgi:hypothetical protein